MKIPKRYEEAKYEDVPKKVRERFEEIPKTKKGLYIFGGIGTGKTHIAYALSKKWHRKEEILPNGKVRVGRNSMFLNVTEMLREWRDDFSRPWGSKEHPEEHLLRYKGLLFLDDLGAEKVTEWVNETLYLILNHRYNEILPTIITSNYSLDELSERIGDRTTSRIAGMCDVVELKGEDKRI